MQKKYKKFLIDCDGVVWHGQHAIPGSLEFIKKVKATNGRCEVHFVTNGNDKARINYLEKFNKLGFKNLSINEITTASSAAASYISTYRPQFKTCYVVGEIGLCKEIEMVNVKVVKPKFSLPSQRIKHDTYVDLARTLDPPRVDVVVAGDDSEFCYEKLCIAALYLQRGAEFVATNKDAFDIIPGAGGIPGAGTIMREILRTRGFNPSETLMIGDRLDTDMAFGNLAGIDTALVLTGVTTAEEEALLPSAKGDGITGIIHQQIEDQNQLPAVLPLKPKYVFGALKDMMDLIDVGDEHASKKSKL